MDTHTNLGVRLVQNDEEHVETRKQGVGQVNVASDPLAVIVIAINGICRRHHAASGVE